MKYFLFILCNIIININTQDTNKNHDSYITNGDECKTDFECKNSGCCKNGKCQESKECYKDIKKINIIFAGIGLIYLIIIIVYYICEVLKRRKKVKKE